MIILQSALAAMNERTRELEADTARLRDLVEKFQRGGVSSLFLDHDEVQGNPDGSFCDD